MSDRSSGLRAPTKRGRGQSENSLLVAKNAPRSCRTKAKVDDNSEEDIEINVKIGRGKGVSNRSADKESSAVSKQKGTNSKAAVSVEASIEEKETEVDLETTLNDDSDNDDIDSANMDDEGDESDDGDTVPLDQVLQKQSKKEKHMTATSRRSSLSVPLSRTNSGDNNSKMGHISSDNSPHGSLSYSDTGTIEMPVDVGLAADLDRALKKLLQYEQQLKSSQEDNKQANATIQTLTQALEKENKDHVNVRNEYATLQNELSHAEILINDMEGVTSELRNQVEVQHDTEDKLVKSLDDAVEEVQSLQSQIQTLEVTLEGSVGEVNDIKTELSTVMKQMEAREQEIEKERNEIEHMKTKEVELQGLLEVADMNMNALQIENSRLSQRVSEMENEKATMQQQPNMEASVNEELKCLKDENQRLSEKHVAEITALKAEKEQIEIDLKELQSQVDELDADMLSKMAMHRDTLKELQAMKTSDEEKEKQMKALTEQVFTLQGIIDTTTSNKDDNEKENADEEKDHEKDLKMQRELATKEVRIKELEMSVKSLQNEVTTAENADRTSEDMAELHRLMSTVESLQKEKESISTQLGHSQEMVSKLRNQLNSKEESFSKHVHDGDTFKRKISDQQMKILDLETSLSAREGVLFDTQKKYDSMRKQVEKLEKELSKKDDDITEMDNELFELRQQLQEAEDKDKEGVDMLTGQEVEELKTRLIEKETLIREKEERIIHLEKAKLTKDQLEKIKHVKSEQKRLLKENKTLLAQLDALRGTKGDGQEDPVLSLKLSEASSRLAEYEKERENILSVLEGWGIPVQQLRDLSFSDDLTLDASDLDISNTLRKALSTLQQSASHMNGHETNRNEEHHAEITSLETEISILHQEKRDLRKENNLLKSKMEKINTGGSVAGGGKTPGGGAGGRTPLSTASLASVSYNVEDKENMPVMRSGSKGGKRGLSEVEGGAVEGKKPRGLAPRKE